MMENTITIKTGNTRTSKDGSPVFVERVYLVPKNVVNASYFQLAVQYHTYKHFELKLLGDIEKIRLTLESLPEDSIDYETLNSAIDELIPMQLSYASEFTNFKDSITEELVETFDDDIFAEMYAILKGDIKSYSGIKRITDKKGNVSLETVTPKLYENFQKEIETRTSALFKVFNPDSPCNKETREKVFNNLRSIANYYMPDRTKNVLSEMYKNIKMDKLNGKYFSEYFSGCAKLKNGKNGGSINTLQKSMNLHIQLWHTMARYLGCEESIQKIDNARKANDSAIQALNDLINSSRTENTTK